MGIQTKITINIDELKVFLTNTRIKALTTATRQSMNRSLSSLQTKANKTAREHRKLKAGVIKRKYFRLQKAVGLDLLNMEASLEISGRPLSLIHFVKGSKDPPNQKGVPIAKRKRVRVEVRPGRQVRLKRAFIAKARGGVNHVFIRDSRDDTMQKLAAPSLAHLFSKKEIRTPLEVFAKKKFLTEFERTFQHQLDRQIARRLRK